VGIEEAHPVEPSQDFVLRDVSPNPFREGVEVNYDLSRAAPVRLSVCNRTGQEVRELAWGRRGSGPHKVVWDGKDDAGERLPTGTYFCCLVSGECTATKKLVKLD